MSIARQLFNDMRPFFRLLEEPLSRSSAMYSRPRSLLNDPFFQPSNTMRPALDVTEQGNNYIVEAELPGVKKENLEVRIGDAGRSVTIEGKTFRRSYGNDATPAVAAAETEADVDTPISSFEDSITVDKPNETAVSANTNANVATESSSFSRTVWLPRAVDERRVSAKLAEGILTLTIPKAEDKDSVKVDIE
ncbi:hypothetical protein HWV62_19031 [Athelia sp. TMB]|nr:hypothetical protein HWV62_34375 [Athelia sp. TMB]KAF7983799.1 hypothetical protein HWV62_19031 [Athelia sp. TMB]